MFCHLDLRDDISENYYVKHCGSERGCMQNLLWHSILFMIITIKLLSAVQLPSLRIKYQFLSHREVCMYGAEENECYNSHCSQH